jgi:hypothetical protein
MLFMIPNGYRNADPAAMPPADLVAKMMEFNESLVKAGVLLSLDGLRPQSTATRLSFTGGRATITDGPFAEAKETVGGYWLLQCSSQEEAVQWASRCPAQDGDVIEVRQVQEMSDFPPDAYAGVSEELKAVGKKSLPGS